MTLRQWGGVLLTLATVTGCQPESPKAAATPTPMAVPSAEESVLLDLDQLVLRWAPGMGAAQRDFAEAAVRSTWLEVALAAGDWPGAANELGSVRRKLESLQASDAAPAGVKQLTGALLSAAQLAAAFGRLMKDATVATWLSESQSDNGAAPTPEDTLSPLPGETESAPAGSPSPATL